MATDPITGEAHPLVLPLTEDAKALFVQWHDEHCQKAEACQVPFLPGAYSKLKGYCPRFALIHALCLDPKAQAVGAESVAAASDLTEYFIAHFAKIAPLLTRRRPSEEAKCEADIIRRLGGGKIETKRDLQRSLPQYQAKVFNPVFNALREADRLEEVEKPGSRRGRKGFRLTED